MKQFLKKIIPASLQRRLRRIKRWMKTGRGRAAVRRACRADARRFIRSAMATKGEHSLENMRALMLMYSHSLEKGLSLETPRAMFGFKTVRALQRLTEEYIRDFGADWVTDCTAATLQAYYDFNLCQQDCAGEGQDALKALERWLKTHSPCVSDFEAGTRLVSGEELRAKGCIPLDFFFSRYSIRNFSPAPVDENVLKEAVRIACKSPSVCNRQAWRAKCIRNPELISKIQAAAGGARGFAEEVGTLLLVTAELSAFHGVSERHQGWVDGGIFTMSLLYALHSLGLGSCCLNCCLANDEELQIRGWLNIPESEVLIARIAVGHYPDRLNVAVSPRRGMDDILKVY